MILSVYHETGIREFGIVTGTFHDVLKSFFSSSAVHPEIRSGKLRLTFLYNPEWHRGNGTSVLAGASFVQDEPAFLLVMSDHVFAPGFFSTFLQKWKENSSGENSRENCEITWLAGWLGSPPPWIDQNDVTRVCVKRSPAGWILSAIGKNLSEWNACDTGAFVGTPSLLRALQEVARTSREVSLSSGIQRLADQNCARLVPVNPLGWVDVDTPRDVQFARRFLLQHLAKPTDGPISRHLNRKISRFFTSLLVERPQISPMHITVFSFLLGVLGTLLMGIPHPGFLVVGATLVQFASILDGTDGEIARLRFEASEYGGWIDAVLDRYTDTLVFLALGIHLMLGGKDLLFSLLFPEFVMAPPAGVFLTALAISGALISSYTADKYDAFIRRILQKSSSSSRPLRLGRDVRLFLVWIGSLLLSPVVTLFVSGVLDHLEILRRIYVLSLSEKKKK